jgi:hypothetical protein
VPFGPTIADWAYGENIATTTIELHGVKIFWSESCICKYQDLTMNNIVEDHGENRFANGQSSRDLRATLCGAELETQLMEAVDNVGDFLRFLKISTRVDAKKPRLF